MPKKRRFEPGKQYIVQEDDKFFMYYGHPSRSTVKIDVTSAVIIGMRIQEGSTEGVEYICK